MIEERYNYSNGRMGKVRPVFLMVSLLAGMMACITFSESQLLTFPKILVTESNSQVRKDGGVKTTTVVTKEQLLQTTMKVRRQLADLAEVMEKNSTYMLPSSTALDKSAVHYNMTFDISPLYDIVDEALNKLGVKGLYFWVFFDGQLDWWFENRPDEEEHWQCWKTHGTHLCDGYEPWWFYHYIGTITAEKLFTEGSLLWDPLTGEYVETMSELLHKIHKKQADTKDWVGDMSFHAQHALLWHYAAVMIPDMDSYPTEMGKAMCGDEYAYQKVTQEADGKDLAKECFHGMGHAIFYVILRQQIEEEEQKRQQALSLPLRSKKKRWTARTQFRPSVGLELTQESWCKIYRYCQTDMTEKEGYVVDVADRCIGGARHSVRIFSPDDDMRWHYTTKMKVRDQYFDDEMEKCRREEQSR